MTILTKVLEDDKTWDGEPLTDEQKHDILIFTGWGDMVASVEGA